jgi:hypothetical protein
MPKNNLSPWDTSIVNEEYVGYLLRECKRVFYTTILSVVKSHYPKTVLVFTNIRPLLVSPAIQLPSITTQLMDPKLTRNMDFKTLTSIFEAKVPSVMCAILESKVT